jgi:hypothetical protein
MRAKVRGAERAREERSADLDRRASMFWMLHEAGASYGAIARGAGLSPGRVRQVCQDYAYQLHRRTEYVTGREPFMDRLRRASALLGAAERDKGRILEPRFASSLAPPAAQGEAHPSQGSRRPRTTAPKRPPRGFDPT